ncbi:IclR family transcriptional regulator [Desulfitobacterium sp.]|uniref:IclR family transcriptional regulator n=1 Tax=Desulfitobacterium sp. TaxID=49981 RepID=UPI002BC7F7A0|nr:IclR family transcriptional regulator [Desulfitobacterium sp.]HVJ49618.1 IclR family transcriptional regulator [Desulfitobacterium sp.]
MNTNAYDEHLLSSVKNALRILRSFSLVEPEKRVTALAAELGLGKSTVSRLLTTLASEGFVMKDHETQQYSLGLSILHLNTVMTSKLEINRESLPVLQHLVDDIGETAHIATLAGMDVVYLNIVECKHPVRMLSHIGRRNPVHCTSSGKVMLAYQNKTVIDQLIDRGLEQYTANTIINPDEFRTALNTIRLQKYAFSIEELLEGLMSIAAPIWDYTNRVNYAVTVIGPISRMNPIRLAIVNKVKSAAMEITRRIG